MNDNTFEPSHPSTPMAHMATGPTTESTSELTSESTSELTNELRSPATDPIGTRSHRGPAWGTMVLGLILLVFAAQALLRTTTNLAWPGNAPGTAIGVGVLLMVVGLVASRRRR